MKQNQRWRIFPFVVKKKNETKIDQGKGVEITAVKPPKILKDKFILNITRKSKNTF